MSYRIVIPAMWSRRPAENYPGPVDDEAVAFPTLDESEMAVLDTLGTRRTVRSDEYLYREGDASYDFYVIRSGAAEITVQDGGEEKIIVRHGPGRFLGELNLLTGMRVYVSARVVEAGEVIVVPASSLRHLLATRPGLGDKILAAFIARRSVLLNGAATAAIRVIGSRFSPESLQLREFLSRSRIPHEWVDADVEGAVEQLLRESDVDPSDLPVVIASGVVLRHTTPGELSSYLGLTVDNLPERCFDLVVVGGGPAGLAAAVYGASEGLTTLGLERAIVGGQAGSSSRIENYLGFPDRNLRRRSDSACLHPGGEVRSPSDGSLRGDSASRRSGPPRAHTRRRLGCSGPRRDRCDRRQVPATRCRSPRGIRG